MKKPLTALAVVALGLTAAATTLSLTGCAECTRYEMKVVNYQECTSRSNTGHCTNWSYSQKMENVCVERGGSGGNFPTGADVAAQAEAATAGGLTAGTESTSTNDLDAKWSREEQRANAESAIAARRGCYRSPAIACIAEMGETLPEMAEGAADRIDLYSSAAVLHAMNGDDPAMRRSLAESRALSIENGEYFDHALHLAMTARILADRGSRATAREALEAAEEWAAKMSAPWKRVRVGVQLAAAHHAFGDRAAAERRLQTVIQEARAPGSSVDDSMMALRNVMEWRLERGQKKEARRLYDEIRDLSGGLDLTGEGGYDLGTANGFRELAMAQLAIGEPGQAALAADMYAKAAAGQKDDFWRGYLPGRVAYLREEIKVAQGGKPFASNVTPPESFADPDDRPDVWLRLAKAHLKDGNAKGLRDAIGGLMTAMDEDRWGPDTRMSRLLMVAELLASPEGRALSKSWSGGAAGG